MKKSMACAVLRCLLGNRWVFLADDGFLGRWLWIWNDGRERGLKIILCVVVLYSSVMTVCMYACMYGMLLTSRVNMFDSLLAVVIVKTRGSRKQKVWYLGAYCLDM